MAHDPVWKRVVGGVVGLGIAIALLTVLRQRGVSGQTIGQWEQAIVFAAAAATVVLWIVKRHQRQP